MATENYTTTATWATLDKQNGKHYGRSKPRLLLRAESLLEEYHDELRRDDLPTDYALEVFDQMMTVKAYKDLLYDRWMESFNRHWSDDPRHYGQIEY